MYTPAHFEECDPAEVADLIAAHPLAAIIASTPEGLVANHVPMLADGEGRLVGHIAKANRLHDLVADGGDVLLIFRGEDAYVSPNWYPSKQEHHRHVPTWNYQVVHVHGTITFHHGNAFKRRVISKLTTMMERRTNGADGWRMGDAPADYLATMVDNIVGFEIAINRIVAKSKVSQNRDPGDFHRVTAKMQESGSAELADRMRRHADRDRKG